MTRSTLQHLTDSRLLRYFTLLVSRDRKTTARLIACMAEIDERRLYLPAGYDSMYAYCLGEFRMSEDCAYKRIQAARAAQRFPEILPAMADGRLHLTAVVLLAPCLTQANAGELLVEAEHQTKAAIKDLLARRFPGSEHLPLITATTESLAPVTGGELVPEPVPTPSPQLVPEPVAVVQPVATSRPKSTVAPLAAERFALHLSMGQSLRDKLRRAQELLGHQIPAGDLAAVLEQALDLLIKHEEKKKFAATDRPQAKPRQTKSPRSIPAHVKRAVRERDKERCTFVSDSGHRCEARSPIEYD